MTVRFLEYYLGDKGIRLDYVVIHHQKEYYVTVLTKLNLLESLHPDKHYEYLSLNHNGYHELIKRAWEMEWTPTKKPNTHTVKVYPVDWECTARLFIRLVKFTVPQQYYDANGELIVSNDPTSSAE